MRGISLFLAALFVLAVATSSSHTTTKVAFTGGTCQGDDLFARVGTEVLKIRT